MDVVRNHLLCFLLCDLNSSHVNLCSIKVHALIATLLIKTAFVFLFIKLKCRKKKYTYMM